MAVLATAVMTFGGSAVLATPATAAPGDRVVFADPDLEDVVNDKLAQPHGTAVTEGDAATITNLDASGASISDLGGIQFLTALSDLNLNDNEISDSSLSNLSGLSSLNRLQMTDNEVTNLSALGGLTSLQTLSVSRNQITDVSALSGLTSMVALYMTENNITNVSALSGLTNLIQLELRDNSVTDLSALSGLTNLTYLNVAAQVADLPDANTGVITPNPVVDIGGVPIPVSSSDSGYTYDSGADEWTFSMSGTKTLVWNAPVSVGGVTDTTFSGTISQRIRQAPLVPAQPQDPEVTQAVCANGDIVGPRIDLPTTDGIDYTIEGDVAPGATVAVRATPTEGHYIDTDPASDWTGDSDGLFGVLEITLDPVDCDAPPVIDAGDPSEASGVDDHLPDTGASQALMAAGVLGALMVIAGAGFVAVRRRVAS